MTTQIQRSFDFSGGIQTRTTWQLAKPNEVDDAINGRFDQTLGSIVRRNGYTIKPGTLGSGKRGNGFHESKWASGNKVIAAVNDSGDTITKLKIYDNIGGSWSDLTLPNTIDPNTRVQMIDSLGETYVAGKSTTTGNRMSLFNIVSTPTVSATRSLINAPKARFIAEFGGALYAINCNVGGTVYADRAYRSSNALGVVTFVQGNQISLNTTTFVLKVDSVRYLKVGMVFDFYLAGNSTELYDSVTITAVDKNANTITFTPPLISFTNANVNTSTDVVTVGANMPTGTPFTISTSGTISTGLSTGVTYYAINQSGTTIKVASSLVNANAGVAIDITAAGSGTFVVNSGLSDNDEIWLHGRHSELSYLWNTDYPTPQTADFLAIPPGVDSDTEITAYGKSNNRLFFYTKNSTYKWDNANLITVYEDDGCISHETVQNIGDWLIWLTAEGRIRARNDATGQDELISRGIEPTLLDNVAMTNLTDADAGRINNLYKICLGTVNGTVLRLVYDFDSNNWAHDQLPDSPTIHIRSDMDGVRSIFFLDTVGNMYTDDTGNLDNTKTIPFIVTFGRDNFGSEQLKNYHGVFMYGGNITGASVKCMLDNGDVKDCGMLKEEVTKIAFSGIRGQFQGRDINVIVSHNSQGAPPHIDGYATYWNQEEDKFGKPS